MALQDSLNQAAWGFIQDWMQRRNQAMQMEAMKAQQEGWSKYQQEGASLETQRLLDQLQGQKEAAYYMGLLGLSEQDIPKMMQTMDIFGRLEPYKGAMPEALKGMIPGLRGKADMLRSGLGPLLEGQTNVPGVDPTEMIQAMGGIQNYLRAAETGKGRISLQEQLPGQRANAAANLLDRMGGGKPDEVVSDREFKSIEKTKDDLDRLYAKHFYTGPKSSSDAQYMAIVRDMMPPGVLGEDASQQQEKAQEWIKNIGVEFFDDLIGRAQSIYTRASRNQINAAERRFMAAASSPYRMAMRYAREKEYLLQGYDKLFPSPPPGVRSIRGVFELEESQLTPEEYMLKEKIKNNIWNVMFAGEQ